MKIAIVLPQLENHGGAERVVSYLANYWATNGYQLVLITFVKQQSICYQLNNNIEIQYLNNKKNTIFSITKLLVYIFSLRKLLSNNKIDIAIGVDIKANLLLRLASYNISNLITIATEHRHPPLVPQNKFILKVIRRIYSSMHAVVALTQASQNWFNQYTKFKQVALIPNPLIYPLINSQPIVAPNTIVNNNNKTLLAVGRLHPQKGFDLLIPIFAKLVIKHNDWQLVILGEGDQRQQLELQRQQCNLNNKVYLPGAIGNLADWYQFADVFVLSSRYEGLPCALIEAMAYGLPVVSFNCKTGPSDIITHGVDGLLVADGKADKLTQSIDRLMSNANLRKKLAKQAITISNKFNICNIGAMWNNLFADLKENTL